MQYNCKAGEIMSKSPTIGEKVLKVLKSGTKTRAEIDESVPHQKGSISSSITRLEKRGEIVRVEEKSFRLRTEDDDRPPTENPRGELENAETINKLLNLYDTVLDNVGLTIQKELRSTATIAEKIDLIKSLRWLGATVDQLMKRWSLVHRGYDTNTRQAQEDAKAKTAKTEQEQLKNAPLEERILVVGHYDPRMRKLWDSLPVEEQEKHTV